MSSLHRTSIDMWKSIDVQCNLVIIKYSCKNETKGLFTHNEIYPDILNQISTGIIFCIDE